MHRVQKDAADNRVGGRKRGKNGRSRIVYVRNYVWLWHEATAGTKYTSFKQLTRINAIGGINIEPEQIDASALEDAITRYVKGRADTDQSRVRGQ